MEERVAANGDDDELSRGVGQVDARTALVEGFQLLVGDGFPELALKSAICFQ